MRDLAHIAARAFNTPLLIHPRKAEVIASVLAERIGVAPMVDIAAAQAAGDPHAHVDGRHNMLDRFDGERRGPKVTNAYGDTFTQNRYLYRDGMALVTVEGTLVNRGAWIGADMSGMTSYEGIAAQLASAAADRDVDEIVIDIESGGGEAVGAFEMADFVRGIAAEKPVTAVVNGMAASAAYALASGATRIVTAPSGISGSIGVVLLHLDRSKQLDKQGVKPTLIFAGDHKVDGNPFEALSPDVRADLQAEIDTLYGMFVATVASGRPRMNAESIRATQARTFIGAEAVAVGLADDIGTLADVASGLMSNRARALPSRRTSMTTNTDTVARADHDTALSAARTDSHAAGVAAGASAERTRIAAILDGENAKGRETLARHFAFQTDMATTAANAALGAAPIAAAAPIVAVVDKTAAGAALLAAVPRPDVKPDTGHATEMTDAQKGAAEARALLGKPIAA